MNPNATRYDRQLGSLQEGSETVILQDIKAGDEIRLMRSPVDILVSKLTALQTVFYQIHSEQNSSSSSSRVSRS